MNFSLLNDTIAPLSHDAMTAARAALMMKKLEFLQRVNNGLRDVAEAVYELEQGRISTRKGMRL